MNPSKHTRSVTLTLFAIGSVLLFNLACHSQIIIRASIVNIANKLQQNDQVHFGYAVGYAGRPETNNRYYKLYKRLAAKASTEELVELTKSNSALLVVYSFDILQRRDYNGLKNIFLQHLNDTTWFWTASGCTGILDKVNWFMLSRLKPLDNSTEAILTKSEYDFYCNRFKREDPFFICH